jgi:hypothetical protein
VLIIVISMARCEFVVIAIVKHHFLVFVFVQQRVARKLWSHDLRVRLLSLVSSVSLLLWYRTVLLSDDEIRDDGDRWSVRKRDDGSKSAGGRRYLQYVRK